MKRIHLFEFEDLPWFPDALRQYMTLYLVSLHKLLGTSQMIAPLVLRALEKTSVKKIIDLCSGGGGPMLDVAQQLKTKAGLEKLELTLTDLFPNKTASKLINSKKTPGLRYLLDPIDATNVKEDLRGVRTMICSMHHMQPQQARGILADAARKLQPLCIFEVSDNSPPIAVWWITIPAVFFLVLCLTPWVRPLSLKQIFLTYGVPVLPLVIAWDGAVSNARTYTKEDLHELLASLDFDEKAYHWEIGALQKKLYPGKMLYLIGLPQKSV